MQAHADERPAVAVVPVEVDAHTFKVIRRGRKIGRFPDVLPKILQEPCAEHLEVAPGHKLQPDLGRLPRLGKVGNERRQVFPFLRALCKGDEKAGHEIGAVVKEVVFL